MSKLLLVSLLVAAAGMPLSSATAASSCPPVQRLVWRAPQRINWQLAETPLWFSLGHPARVLCFIPVGVAEEGGTVETRDGAGRAIAIRLELRDVLAFDPGTSVPKETRLVRSETIRADDPKARERKAGWGFPSEQGKDFEFGLVPALEHQTLMRIYRHDEAPFWNTLMVHGEASTEPLPPALAAASGSASAFTVFMSHTIVCELLNDPDLKMTSTYLEPDDPPSTNWIAKEAVRAPWSNGKATLEPARGSLVFEKGAMRFTAFSESARQAAETLAREAREKGLPGMSLNWEKESKMPDGLGTDPGK